jgi:hypothetical protein
MEEETTRLQHLEQQVRRLRRTVNLLSVGLLVLLGALTLAAASEPQELTLQKLTIVDTEGKGRIVAAALPDGRAAILHYDRDGEARIMTTTLAYGKAAISLMDRKGRVTWGKHTE